MFFRNHNNVDHGPVPDETQECLERGFREESSCATADDDCCNEAECYEDDAGDAESPGTEVLGVHGERVVVHCASELPNGNILIFDNGTFRKGESATYSRVIEVSRASRSIVWQYRDPHPMTFFTPFMGGAQRLGNGNTLITEAAFGRVFEVTSEGGLCWEWVNDEFADYEGLGAEEIEGLFDYPANALFRAYKYTPEEIPWLTEK